MTQKFTYTKDGSYETLYSLKTGNIEAAQRELLIRAKANSEAQLGVYSGSGAAGKAASQSLDVKNYVY